MILKSIHLNKLGFWKSLFVSLALCFTLSPTLSAQDYLCFTATNNGTTIKLNRGGDASRNSSFTNFSYKVVNADGSIATDWIGYKISAVRDWFDYKWSSPEITLSAGQKIYFKAASTNTKLCNSISSSVGGSLETIGVRHVDGDFYYFEFGKEVNASGNVMSLLDPSCNQTTAPANAFSGLFQNCYYLRTAPVLPATSVGSDAYAYMFFNCTGLEAAPDLPATSLGNGCYQWMFAGCESLKALNVDFTSWGTSNTQYTSNWVADTENGALQSHRFPVTGNISCPRELNDIRGASNVPNGWNALRKGVDNYMFVSWNGEKLGDLWNSVLSWVNISTTLTATIKFTQNTSFTNNWDLQYSYDGLTFNDFDFANGISINNKEHPGIYLKSKTGRNALNTLSNYYTFSVTLNSNLAQLISGNTDGVIDISGNVMSLIDPTLLKTEVPNYAFYKLFAGNTKIYSAPELPGLELGAGCYASMFEGCTSLKSAPDLPATSLSNNCYMNMFSGCTSMDFIRVFFEDWRVFDENGIPQSNVPTIGWTKNVASSGTFMCPENLDQKFNGTADDKKSDGTYMYAYIPWSSVEEITEENDYLCFTVTSASGSIRLNKSADDLTNLDGKLFYSFTPWSESSWTEYKWNGKIGSLITLDKKQNQAKIYFRNSTTDETGKVSENGKYYQFVMTGNIEASGNIMSLLKKDCNLSFVPKYAFFQLFFQCKSLKKAPELPATVLNTSCYRNMFARSGIVSAPVLPATVMKSSCYLGMFIGCNDLTSAPQLPSLYLAQSCYKEMFRECTSLTSAPTLPANNLAKECYLEMFKGCKNLNFIKVGFTEWDTTTNKYTNSWCGNTDKNTFSPSGVFVGPEYLAEIIGESNIPEHWTITKDGGENDFLCFTSERNGSKVSLKKNGNPANVNLVHSFDGGNTWYTYNIGDEITLNTSGDHQRVMFRAGTVSTEGATSVAAEYHASTFSESDSKYYSFVAKVGSFKVSGNIMSLLHSDCKSDVVPEYAFYKLFNYCSAITSAPKLPSNTLSAHCYQNLFLGCSNLLEVPDLPANNLAPHCYRGMFQNCFKITKAPELSATSVPEYAYQEMFRDCLNLVAAPNLMATNLGNSCYYLMFVGCRSLNYIKVGFSSWGKNNNQFTKYWAQDCNSASHNVAEHTFSTSGTFISPKDLDCTIVGISNVPHGWIANPYALCFTAESKSTLRLAKVGSPSAISLVYSTDGCNTWKPYTWNSDNDGDVVITLKKGESVFFKATSGSPNATISQANNYYQFKMTGTIAASGNIMALLDSDDEELTTISTTYCFANLFKGCSSLTTAPELPATTLTQGCYTAMFNGCSALLEAPALPATKMARYCYDAMFQGCSNLISSPYISATELAEECFKHMFAQCENLRQISVAFESWTGSDNKTASSAWVQNVSPTGTFIGPGALPKTRNTESNPTNDVGPYIPKGWIIPTDLCFVADQYGTTVTLNCVKNGSISDSNLDGIAGFEYSYDDVTWVNYTPSTTIQLREVGDRVYFRGKPTSNPQGPLYKDANNYYRFSISGYVSCMGSIGSLTIANYNSQWMDKNDMFRSLFEGCEGLTRAPELPAKGSCNPNERFFMNLFKGCKDLTYAPNLPWKDVSASAYEGMFEGCESLVNPPTIARPNNMRVALYRNMFKGCKSLASAPSLPFNVMMESCYESMFEGCESLIDPPALYDGDTWNNYTLAKKCFKNMFKDCKSLKSSPQINTKTVYESCFEGMFEGCTSLETAPMLGSTTLQKNCYKSMFAGCTSLISAPELPAGTLVDGCYAYMFDGCSSLRNMAVGFKNWYDNSEHPSATYYWVDGVSKNGTFMCPAELTKTFNESHIPYNDTYRWNANDNGDYFCFTLINTGYANLRLVRSGNPTLITYQYSFDRKNWTTIVGDTYAQLMGDKTAGTNVYIKISNGALSTSTSDYWYFEANQPVAVSGNIMSLLDASMEKQDVPSYSFYKLFSGVGANLQDVSGLKLPATKVGDYAYAEMFSGCTYLKNNATTAPELPATTIGKYCYKNLFDGWKKLVNVQKTLPATTLAEGCYSAMFQNCEALVKAPILPAETVKTKCYDNMFNNCKKLNYLNLSLTSWPASGFQNWVNGVPTTGTFECPWTLLNDAVIKWGSSDTKNCYGAAKIPKDGNNPWTLIVKTNMSMNYATGILTISGGSIIKYDTTFDKDHDPTFNNASNTVNHDDVTIDLNDWLSDATKLDSITYYALATSSIGLATQPTVNSLTIYRLPRYAGYCLADNTTALEEALYFASKVSSKSYPVRIFMPDGEYKLDKTLKVSDWTSLIGETIEGTKLMSSATDGALDITGKNAYLQDMTISNNSGTSDIAFYDRSNPLTTLNVALGTGCRYVKDGVTQGSSTSLFWNRSDDETQVDVDSICVNGNTISICATGATAYLVRIKGAGYSLVSGADLYILRDLTDGNVSIRAANSRGGFGDPGDYYKFAKNSSEAGEYMVLHEKIKLNSKGYASFCYDDDDASVLRVYGAGAYMAKYNQYKNLITLNHINNYDYVPKKTGVILFGRPDTYITLYKLTAAEMYYYEEEIGYDGHANDLKGNWGAKDLKYADNPGSAYDPIKPATGYKLYGLKKDTDTFTYLNAGGVIKRNKAYLELPEGSLGSSSALRMVFYDGWDELEEEFEDETGITSISTSVSFGKAYNLEGVRTDETKGLLIKDGKVILQK